MKQKDYPRAVVLRKSIVIITVVIAAFIVLLILHNFLKADEAQKMKQVDDAAKVSTVATLADTKWYANQTVNKSVVAPLPPVKPVENAQRQQRHFYQPSSAHQHAEQAILSAMRAPITSNQLTPENSQQLGESTNGTSNNFATPEGASQLGTDQNMQAEKKAFIEASNAASDDDYLSSVLKNPISPFELQAGTIIPGILITGINSDLPGQITGQVRENVYDSISGKYVLVPQGAKITGLYDSQVAYGQERVLVVWKRIIFPNGQSIDLQGMPGVDMSGYAGFHDEVNNHYGKIFGSVILMSILGAGAQLSQPQNTNNNPFAGPTVGQTLAQSLGTNLADTGTMITSKNINIQPTLQIRPGYEFNISVTKDMVFPGPYSNQ